MAKSMIKNHAGDFSQTIYVPMSSTDAKSFAEDFLDGASKIYESSVSQGSDVGVTLAKEVSVQVSNTTTGKKAYLRFIAKNTFNTDEIRTALTGITVNGILVDKVVFINVKRLAFS